MVFGAILEKGEQFYSHILGILQAVEPLHEPFNWLVTDCECYPNDPMVGDMFSREYCFLSGAELCALLEQDDFQWVWGVFSAFAKDVPLEEILMHPLPYADHNPAFWKNPLTMQLPLAQIEIVAFDSSLTLFFSKEQSYVDRFRQAFPLSEDLREYNEREAK